LTQFLQRHNKESNLLRTNPDYFPLIKRAEKKHVEFPVCIRKQLAEKAGTARLNILPDKNRQLS